ncbi:MAG: 2'-5' RNA ligase family protein [Candidatus Nanopelagicales bacterium]
MPTRTSAGRRLGVAVELPPAIADPLEAARRRSGDPAADHMAPHITLVPPVHVPGASLDEVHELLASAAAAVRPFEVHLRGTGTFRPVSDVVFVTVASGIGALERLAAALRVRPLDPPLHFPYHPHVTLAHDVTDDALDRVYHELSGFEARFAVDSFRLYEHDPLTAARPDGGRRWHPVADLSLG